MIVIIGTPGGRAGRSGWSLAGTAALTAAAAASAGARVELIGRAGEDPEGDAVSLALARAGVGHAALLRTAGVRTPVVSEEVDALAELAADAQGAEPGTLPLEPADVDLALRYLTDYRVIVVAEPQPVDVVRTVAEAAQFASARLVLVARGDAGAPDDAIVLEPPETDPDGAFAAFLGAYAAALEAGTDPALALGDETARAGWEPASAD